jgi:hypothetical protein
MREADLRTRGCCLVSHHAPQQDSWRYRLGWRSFPNTTGHEASWNVLSGGNWQVHALCLSLQIVVICYHLAGVRSGALIWNVVEGGHAGRLVEVAHRRDTAG